MARSLLPVGIFPTPPLSSLPVLEDNNHSVTLPWQDGQLTTSSRATYQKNGKKKKLCPSRWSQITTVQGSTEMTAPVDAQSNLV